MMRWQNCVAFETEQAYNANVRIIGNGSICDYFDSFTICKPQTFPAFFYLEQNAYEPYWKACSKDFVLNRWETAIQGFVGMVEELKNGY